MNTVVHKRKRSSNYTPLESQILSELVKQHQSAIEDKRTSTPFLLKKKEAWEQICSSYNLVANSRQRTVEQLKVFYDNKKQKDKKSLTNSKNKSVNTKMVNIPVQNKLPKIEPASDTEYADIEKKNVFSIIRNNSMENVTSDSNKNMATEHTELDKGECGVMLCSGAWSPPAGDQRRSWDPEETLAEYRDFLATASEAQAAETCRKETKANYRELYYKRKMQNAFLERSELQQRARLRREEYQLRVREHQLRVKEHRTRMDHMREENELKIKQLKTYLNLRYF